MAGAERLLASLQRLPANLRSTALTELPKRKSPAKSPGSVI
jgi:hypothetical protein